MNEQEKIMRRYKFYVFLLAFCIFILAFGLGIIYQKYGRGTGDNTTEQRRINNLIRTEQQLTLDGIRGAVDGVTASQRGIEPSIKFLGEVRRITEETNSAIGKLRLADRRSGSLLESITQELNILEDYHRDISRIISNYCLGNKVEPF